MLACSIIPCYIACAHRLHTDDTVACIWAFLFACLNCSIVVVPRLTPSDRIVLMAKCVFDEVGMPQRCFGIPILCSYFFFYLQTLPIYQMLLYTYKNNAHKQLDVTCKNCVGNDQLFSIILSAYFDSRKNWWQSHANIKLFIMIWKFVRRQQRMSLWLVYWKNRMKSPTTKQKRGYIYNSMHIPVFRQQHKFQSATGIFWINLKQQSMWCGINVVINTCTYWHATVNMESFVSHWQTRLLWLLL